MISKPRKYFSAGNTLMNRRLNNIEEKPEKSTVTDKELEQIFRMIP